MHWITFLCHAQRLRRVVLRRALQERRQRESILLMQIIETAAIFKEEQLFTNTYVLRVIGILYSKILTKLVIAHTYIYIYIYIYIYVTYYIILYYMNR